MHNTGQTGGSNDADIDALEPWDIQTGDADVLVGVIDTGVDYNHPDLIDNLWVNAGEIPGNNADAWVHIADTYDGATMGLYYDGDEVISKALTGAIPTTTR